MLALFTSACRIVRPCPSSVSSPSVRERASLSSPALSPSVTVTVVVVDSPSEAPHRPDAHALRAAPPSRSASLTAVAQEALERSLEAIGHSNDVVGDVSARTLSTSLAGILGGMREVRARDGRQHHDDDGAVGEASAVDDDVDGAATATSITASAMLGTVNTQYHFRPR